jgi:hypothetical protein
MDREQVSVHAATVGARPPAFSHGIPAIDASSIEKI